MEYFNQLLKVIPLRHEMIEEGQKIIENLDENKLRIILPMLQSMGNLHSSPELPIHSKDFFTDTYFESAFLPCFRDFLGTVSPYSSHQIVNACIAGPKPNAF